MTTYEHKNNSHIVIKGLPERYSSVEIVYTYINYSFIAFKTQLILTLTTIPRAKKIEAGHIQCTYHAVAY